MDILPKALKLDNIASYEVDLADPAAVYNDPSRRDQYLRMYGNICFDTRQNFINFPLVLIRPLKSPCGAGARRLDCTESRTAQPTPNVRHAAGPRWS